MQVLSLTLKGFRGIRDGLGRDALSLDFERLADGAELVAIAGANGRGKSTVMDNMHPYLTMPSRAAVAGPGGFSYYDHVCLPENEKDLTWAHEGRSYRSQVVIRLNGRRKTEAFLFVLGNVGSWMPLRLDDGTVSDGKIETYTRCVEAVCGSADTFFTSVFSAQGKRQLSTYRNAEIKTLLADLLGQDEIRALGQKAAETARLLKAGLSAIRQELAGLDEEAGRIASERLRLDGASDRVAQGLAARQLAQRKLDVARARHATLSAERDQSRATEMRRAQLLAERKALVDAGTQAIAALKAQNQGEQQRLERLVQRIADRVSRERIRSQALQHTRRQCRAVLDAAGAVGHAVARLPLAERVLSRRTAQTLACRQQAQRLTQCQGAERVAEQKLAGIEREAGKAVLQAEELAHRFGLTDEVPCAGTDLQGQCKLLGDARDAQALIPSAKGHITRLAREKAQAQSELATARRERERLADASQAVAWAECRGDRARERVSRLAVLAAKTGEIAQARTTLVCVEQELAALGKGHAAPADAVETSEEQTEREQIGAARQVVAQQLERQSQQFRDGLNRLEEALAAMPAPYDEQQLAVVVQTMTQAEEAVVAAEQLHLATVREAHQLDALCGRVQTLAVRRSQVQTRIAHVETELGGWNLFARCMSNDGLIALAIDDAGPALSGLANDLLLACYGPRFTASIHTLVETGKGEQREGFDIVVHDGESGESKSVGLMSGGERVWINECLTRAVALYLAQHSGRRYATLFSDEADGPLDPERKRMFMAMKREVLRLGGYTREFFVSQTPELTAMADVVIDLETCIAPAQVTD
ncbi:DNA repair protein [Rhodoferax sediminis]|uniref:DNA repair protein n=1 Tax=Rhodoferax sediminis TaxID=2509614 RepID=A0A515DDR3_9BURK|nr:DNA repair protein [Rhodoferax sediminis]QDL38553.1 DNA repair protein [Rhodoferax sediminis]